MFVGKGIPVRDSRSDDFPELWSPTTTSWCQNVLVSVGSHSKEASGEGLYLWEGDPGLSGLLAVAAHGEAAEVELAELVDLFQNGPAGEMACHGERYWPK